MPVTKPPPVAVFHGVRTSAASVPTGTVLFNDTFTGTDGTVLSAHTSDSGGGWVQHSSYGAAPVEIHGNEVRPTTASQSMYYENVVLPSAEYDVEADIRFLSLIAASQDGICGRVSTSLNTCYYLRYRPAVTGWELGKLVNNTSTVLGSPFVTTPTLGQTYHLKLQIRDALKTVFIDGVSRLTSADNTIAPAGFGSVRWLEASPSDSTGAHIDNFTIKAA